MLILWAGVVSFLLTNHPHRAHPLFHLLFCLGFLLGAASWYLGLTFLILPRIRQWTDRRFHILSKFFAAVLLGGAIFLILKSF